ncbi:MAG: hypothetical protein LBL61_03580, partial [Elusimicrobiota bacterium]|nr:hypothetical protein [Elusimicrobiota bacterium]
DFIEERKHAFTLTPPSPITKGEGEKKEASPVIKGEGEKRRPLLTTPPGFASLRRGTPPTEGN